MTQWKDAGDDEYMLYAGSFALPISSWQTGYDLYNGQGDDVVSVVNIVTGGLKGTCVSLYSWMLSLPPLIYRLY